VFLDHLFSHKQSFIGHIMEAELLAHDFHLHSLGVFLFHKGRLDNIYRGIDWDFDSKYISEVHELVEGDFHAL